MGKKPMIWYLRVKGMADEIDRLPLDGESKTSLLLRQLVLLEWARVFKYRKFSNYAFRMAHEQAKERWNIDLLAEPYKERYSYYNFGKKVIDPLMMAYEVQRQYIEAHRRKKHTIDEIPEGRLDWKPRQ
jgi:hypothetical protein